ncbi:MAG: hypothetical protein CMB82_00925 [Flammeovirgaceae bacterium]|nr:hypothetical protein [Flammeovirgaceae bacterium]
MKYIEFSIILIAFTSCELGYVFGPKIPGIEIEKENLGLSWDQSGNRRYLGKLFSGYIVQKNQKKVLLNKTPFHKGLQEGNMLGYYDDGTKRHQRPYLHGKKHGIHLGWYSNGRLKFEYHFENGKNVGNHKEWYPNGSPMQDRNYVNGQAMGAQKVWRRDGKIRANFVIRENGKKYGLMGMKRCTKIDTKKQMLDPYKGK